MFQDTGDEYLEEVGGIQELLSAGPPLPIPQTGDFPVVGHYPPQAARDALERLEALPPHPESVVNQGREQLGDWLHAAAREVQGTVIFYG